ncbi:hypothetical protein [Portibacter marinus]|uniref:hypothetical protein n=1 Tax=Portibacter marinus TaxID=2898660 RepID=UPI001F44F2D6|nr:hypothetical protein [Portibacter marinus]
MYKFLISKGQTLAFVLGAGLSILFAVLIYLGVKDRSLAEMSIDSLKETTIFDFGIKAALALIGLAILALLIFGIISLFTNFKGAIKLLIGLAIIVGLFFLFYTISVPEESGILARLADEFAITDNISKFISAGIKTTLTLLGLALVIWLFSELRNALK